MTNNFVGKGQDAGRGGDGGAGLPAMVPAPPQSAPGILGIPPGTCSWTGNTAPGTGGTGLPGIPGAVPGGPGFIGGTGGNGTGGRLNATIDARSVVGTLLLDFRGGRGGDGGSGGK